ncbi:MAG: hypothetical protein EXX96DRAFT_601524 [Benjaminiella poitrasii]|nr:MAG: hypothetical protein EXX96DRAFT_601524 [Benjaminiella poitrasii]
MVLKAILLLLFVSLTLAANPRLLFRRGKDDEDTDEPPPVPGALYVGATNILVPDASADVPILVSTTQDQPLCKPKQPIAPAHPLTVLKGYEWLVLTNRIPQPRKLIVDAANHLLVASSDGLYSVRTDKCSNTDIQHIHPDQVHGLAVFQNRLYLARDGLLVSFPYSDGQHTPLATDTVTTVLRNVDDLADVTIDPLGHLYVARGETIKKFNLKVLPETGFDFDQDGEVQAVGARTQGYLGLDAQARLWGLQGVSPSEDIKRADLHNNQNLIDGLAEELNLYEFPNKNYGYPHCMTEYQFDDGSHRGRQWAQTNTGYYDDAYCRQETNNQGPAVPLPPQSGATSVQFFMGQFCSVGGLNTGASSVGLPCNWTDTPLIANHQARSVVRVPFDDVGHRPRLDSAVDVVLQATCRAPGCFSPSGLAVDGFGRLLVSSDETNEIVVVSRVYSDKAVKILTAQVVSDETDVGEEEENDDK